MMSVIRSFLGKRNDLKNKIKYLKMLCCHS